MHGTHHHTQLICATIDSIDIGTSEWQCELVVLVRVWLI